MVASAVDQRGGCHCGKGKGSLRSTPSRVDNTEGIAVGPDRLNDGHDGIVLMEFQRNKFGHDSSLEALVYVKGPRRYR